MKVWVCANCGTPIEPKFPQGVGDEYDFRCPGDDPGCSPRDDRCLMAEEQVDAVEVDFPHPELPSQADLRLLRDLADDGSAHLVGERAKVSGRLLEMLDRLILVAPSGGSR